MPNLREQEITNTFYRCVGSNGAEFKVFFTDIAAFYAAQTGGAVTKENKTRDWLMQQALAVLGQEQWAGEKVTLDWTPSTGVIRNVEIYS